jgi:hypothetical protein
VVTSIVLVALSLALTGADVWLAYVSRLPELVTSPARYVAAYQTTAGLFGHLLVYDARWNPAPIAHLPARAAALSAAAFLAGLVITLRAEPATAANHDRRALHVALMASLVVTNSPFAEEHHYVLVLPSLVIAWWWVALGTVSVTPVTGNVPAVTWRRWGSCAALAAATIALVAPLPYEAQALTDGAMAILAYPRVYGACLLWAWLLFAPENHQLAERRVTMA